MSNDHNAGEHQQHQQRQQQQQQQQQQQSSLPAAAVVSGSASPHLQSSLPRATATPPTTTTTTTTAATMTVTSTLGHSRLLQRDIHERPCAALSAGIMSLYSLINRKHTEERRRCQTGPKYNDGYDDRHGHYIAYAGEEIWGRYTVQSVLGRGSFGTVLKCFDEKHQEQVAAKVIRNGEYFYEQGMREVDIVVRLNNIPTLDNLVARLGKVFLWKNHLVLVFEMLSMNLFQLIQRTNHNGVSLDLTRKFAYQLVLVLKRLEEHDPPIIHCDVKPENVVLRDPSRSSIRLIDFGSACYLHPGAKLYKYIQSRFYRSVEVILELGYDTAIDRWSLGCMLVELHTGVPLFAGLNEVDQIARFTGVLGPVPDEMIERSNRREIFFHDNRHAQTEAAPSRHTAVRTTHDPQGTDHTASPSPVFAAEVLHSLSMTSSISAVTATSTVAAAAASAAGTTLPPLPIASPSSSQHHQHSQPPPTALEGRQPPRNTSTMTGGGGGVSNATKSNHAVAVTPALRRPRTAITVVPSPKRDGMGHMTMEQKKCLTPAATRRGKQSAVVKQASPKPFVSGNAMNAVPLATLPSSRSAAGARPSGSTSKPRLATSSHPHVQNSGSLLSSTRVGRVGMPQTSATVEQQQEQASPTLPKSPFVLRTPPTPEQCQSLEKIIGVYTGGPRGCRQGQPGHDVSDYKVFLDFIKRLLCYDPRKRMTCAEALQHPFLSELERQKQ